ncbi:hypothetical protein [Aggregatibacter kilianii]|uniref:hypothetical protein n=1 Tax=Aggregatibacter kilianii TaxID=2025884 RepID=UPI000D652564|nr:hypothetical protein [Aggregatibacter kilianii]
MKKLNAMLFIGALASLFACTTQPPKKPVKTRFLKNDITQAELNNAMDYKRYHYRCKNAETGSMSYLTSYFPLSVESRKKENFGFYFQLDGGKAIPFDHLENRALNARGSRFEVRYRSYNPIQGSHVDLVAHERSSIYYKNNLGTRKAWLNCKGG